MLKAVMNCYKGYEVTHRIEKEIKEESKAEDLANFQELRIKFMQEHLNEFSRFETSLIKEV